MRRVCSLRQHRESSVARHSILPALDTAGTSRGTVTAVETDVSGSFLKVDNERNESFLNSPAKLEI